MWNSIKNERGLLLPDLVASLPLGVIVIAVMTFSVMNFLVAFTDIKDYTQCQDELFQAIETIRYGYVKENIVRDSPLNGMLSANTVTLSNNNTHINMEIDSVPGKPIGSTIELESTGSMYFTGYYGTTIINENNMGSRIRIFPTDEQRIDGSQKYRITNPTSAFTPLEVDTDPSTMQNRVRLLGVDLIAKVRFRPREDGQSNTEDERLNTRTIRYKTKIYVPNTPSAT